MLTNLPSQDQFFIIKKEYPSHTKHFKDVLLFSFHQQKLFKGEAVSLYVLWDPTAIMENFGLKFSQAKISPLFRKNSAELLVKLEIKAFSLQ